MPLLLAIFTALLFSKCYYLMLAYLIFVFIDTAPEGGGRKLSFIRSLKLWTWLADFFPMTLVKTAELDPSRNYIFGYHPHGIISIGAFTMFGTEARGVSKVFPGIDINVLTLSSNFSVPFFRDLLLSLGFCSVSKTSIESILSRSPGSSCMIVPGGAAESLYAFPGKYDLVIKKRLGIIKMAMKSGAPLIPVLCFGENDVWDQVSNPKGSVLRTIQEKFQKYASFAPPLFHGRGILQYDYGIVPHRRNVVAVVGKPVEVEMKGEPSVEELREVQARYLGELRGIWEEYKDVYAPNRKGELEFVE